MHNDKRVLQLLFPHGKSFFTALALLLTAAIAIILQAGVLSRAITRIFLEHQTWTEIQSLLLFFLGLAVIRWLTHWAGQSVLYKVSAQAKQQVRQQLTARLIHLGPSYASAQRSGELKTLLTDGIARLEAYFSEYIPQVVMAVAIPLLILAFVFPLDLLSAMVFMLTAPLIPLFMILIGDVARLKTRKQWSLLNRLNGYYVDLLQGMMTLKILGCSDEMAVRIRQITGQFRDTTMGVLRIAFLSSLVLELLSTLATAIIAVEIGLRLLYDKISFEQALFILILAPEFYQPLRRLGAHFHAGLEGLAAANQIYAVLDQETGKQQGSSTEIDLAQGIEFSGVGYTYPGASAAALHDLTFRLEPGCRTALVGPSGAGKSTITSLLLAFAEPDKGQILIGATPLRGLAADAWRTLIAWVPHFPFLFHASITENMRLARPDASRAQIQRAAEWAHLHDFIKTLPQGYDTIIGDRGVRLSGGQAQRLALARAFLRDGPLVILDEPTSSLDRESENLVLEATERLIKGKTVLTIAHRLHTVESSDVILFIESGRIVEKGSHQELLRRHGRYAEFLQMSGGLA